MIDYIDFILAEEDRKRAEYEKTIKGECDWCYNLIYEGETYFASEEEMVCEECMSKFEERTA